MKEKKKELRLTPREKEVANLMINGFLDKQIAFELRIKYKTVRRHIENMLLKSSCISSKQLSALIVRNNLLSK